MGERMILLDSSFIIAYKVEDDEHHEKASRLIDKIVTGEYGPPVITDYIFDESITVVFNKTHQLKIAIGLGNELMGALDILPINKDIFEKAWNIFKEQENTKFSFTDCTILSFMKEMKINNIATFDKEFEKITSVSIIK